MFAIISTVAVGVTAFEAEEATDVLEPFVALMVNVYNVPFVNPETTIGLDDPVAVIPSGEEVTVYDVAPTEGVNAIDAVALPAVATSDVGTGSGISGVTGALGDEEADEPAALTPDTVNV